VFLKYLERKFKRVLIKILSGISSPTKISVEEFRKLNIKKIAVVRQDNRIGNLIFTIPLLRALKEDYPDCELHAITGYKYGEILSHVKEIDEIIQFNQKRALINPFYYFMFRKSLKKTDYDLVIDAGSMTSLSVNNILLGASARSKVFVGYDRKESSSFLNLPVPKINEKLHESQLLLHLADYLSGKKRHNYPSLMPTNGEIMEADIVVQKLGILPEDKIIGVHIGGRYNKRWDIGNFVKLTDELKKMTAKVIIFSGPDDEEYLKELDIENLDWIFSIHSAPLNLVMGMISKCNIFISGDNGPLHIAAALGIPCVQIFRVDNWERYGYTEPPHKIVMPINPLYGSVVETVRSFEEN